MGDKRYHVGRNDGTGSIYRVASRFEANQKVAELVAATPGKTKEDFYIDGPPEPTEADRVSEAIKNFINEATPGKSLVSQLVNAETDEEREKVVQMMPEEVKAHNKFIQEFAGTYSGMGIGRALELALKLGAPMDIIAAIAVDLGYRAGLAIADQKQLEKMAA